MSKILEQVYADLKKQEAKGLKKYGGTLDANFTSIEMLQHAYEEALDLCMYLKKSIDVIGRINEVKRRVRSKAGTSESLNKEKTK